MRYILAGCGAVLALAATEAAAQPRLDVRGAAARIEIIPETRTDIIAVVTPASGGVLPAPEIRREGETLVVDGKLGRRMRSCSTSAGRASVVVTGIGRVSEDRFPSITIRVPRDVAARVANAGQTRVGAAASADLGLSSCGDMAVAPVAGALKVSVDGSGGVTFATVGGALAASLDGSGDIRGGAVTGAAHVQLDGSGDVVLGAVGGGLWVELDGSGDVEVASANGATKLELDGSGDISVRGGSAPSLVVALDGSGDVNFGGVAGDVEANADGSGDIRVARATGTIRSEGNSVGSVRIGN